MLFTSNIPLKPVISLIMLLSLSTGCNESSDRVINRDKLISLYADVLIISGTLEQEDGSERYFEKLDSVLTLHNVSYDRFKVTLEYYQEDPVLWKDLIDNVTRELEKRRDQERDLSGNRSSS